MLNKNNYHNLIYISYIPDTGGHFLGRIISASNEIYWPYSSSPFDLNIDSSRAKNIIGWIKTDRTKKHPQSVFHYDTDQILRTSMAEKIFYNKAICVQNSKLDDNFFYVFNRRINELGFQNKRLVLPTHTPITNLVRVMPNAKYVFVEINPLNYHSYYKSAISFSHSRDLLQDDMYDPYKKHTEKELIKLGFSGSNFDEYKQMVAFQNLYKDSGRLTKLDFCSWLSNPNYFDINSDHSRIQSAINGYLSDILQEHIWERNEQKEYLLLKYPNNVFYINMSNYTDEKTYTDLCNFLEITPQYNDIKTLPDKKEEHHSLNSEDYVLNGKQLNFIPYEYG